MRWGTSVQRGHPRGHLVMFHPSSVNRRGYLRSISSIMGPPGAHTHTHTISHLENTYSFLTFFFFVLLFQQLHLLISSSSTSLLIHHFSFAPPLPPSLSPSTSSVSPAVPRSGRGVNCLGAPQSPFLKACSCCNCLFCFISPWQLFFPQRGGLTFACSSCTCADEFCACTSVCEPVWVDASVLCLPPSAPPLVCLPCYLSPALLLAWPFSLPAFPPPSIAWANKAIKA